MIYKPKQAERKMTYRKGRVTNRTPGFRVGSVTGVLGSVVGSVIGAKVGGEKGEKIGGAAGRFIGKGLGDLVQNSVNSRNPDNTEEARNAYLVAQASYDQKIWGKKLAQAGYLRDKEFSNERVGVYKRGKDKHVLIGFRGTRIGDLEDMAADAEIFGGKYDGKAFSDATRLVDAVGQKYGGNITLSGHSLGGTKSIQAAKALGVRSYAFNPGTGTGDEFDPGSTEVFRTVMDPISANLKDTGRINYTLGTHALDYFDKYFNPLSENPTYEEAARQGYTAGL
mgnify:CR=1 FL=1